MVKKSEFIIRLENRWSKENFACVGLDPDLNRIPKFLKPKLSPEEIILKFNKKIIDATHDLVCAFKPQISFYEALGHQGMKAFEKTIKYINKTYPEIPIILDAKRGDIRNTNDRYVKAYFENDVDAITVNPYLGGDSLRPFLDKANKGVIILVKTSNPDSGEFQDLPIDLNQISNSYKEKFGELEGLRKLMGTNIVPLYQVVTYAATRKWNKNGNVCLVAGATHPKDLALIRKIAGDVPLLIPGIGAQGGDVQETVQAGMDSRSRGMIINSSQGIIYASNGKDFDKAARQATEKLNRKINKCRKIA